MTVGLGTVVDARTNHVCSLAGETVIEFGIILSQEWKETTKCWWHLLDTLGTGQGTGNSPPGQVCAPRPCTLRDAWILASPYLPSSVNLESASVGPCVSSYCRLWTVPATVRGPTKKQNANVFLAVAASLL